MRPLLSLCTLTLPKANFETIETAYRNKKISFEDYKFYIFNASALGWKNLDVFADLSKNQLTKIKVNVRPSKQVDCKLVFKDREFVLPAGLGEDHFYFDEIPKGEDAWLVGIQYIDHIPCSLCSRLP